MTLHLSSGHSISFRGNQKKQFGALNVERHYAGYPHVFQTSVLMGWNISFRGWNISFMGWNEYHKGSWQSFHAHEYSLLRVLSQTAPS